MRPRHIVLFIVCCFVLLGAIVVVGDWCRPMLGGVRCPEVFSQKSKVESQKLEEQTMVPLELADSTSLELEVRSETADADRVQNTEYRVQNTEYRVQNTEYGVQAVGVLDKFIEGLQEAGEKQVRVVHYGDSQIEEDRITSTLRTYLQNEYGGLGPGLLPLVQTIPTRTVVQYLLIDGQRVTAREGPKRYFVYGPKNQQRDSSNHYGIMGQVAVLDSLCDSVTMHIEPYGKLTSANYFSQLRVWATRDILVDGSRRHQGALRDTLTRLNIDISGIGEVYGVSLESATGVIVDNIPMRGGSGNVFTKMNRKELTEFYEATNTRLIILQFGGNVMPWANTEERVRGYAYSMRKQIRFLRECAPNASILFIGPSDMLTVVDGEKMSYPTIAYMDQQLARISAAEGIAYWSLFKAMGGEGSMQVWQEKGLASSDGVHFYRSGANRAGELLWQWISVKVKGDR